MGVDRLHEPRVDPRYTTDQPRLVLFTIYWRRHQDAGYWFDLKLAQEKDWYIGKTISNAIIVSDSMLAERLVKVVKRDHELSDQRSQPESQVTLKVVGSMID